ncbi:PilW family protein [Sulfurirhabdus autotrophica]|uniref:Type IV pilus assembly protein PilW n=1 Tax=Sulfurirhabdus autotrophica TaxID=1706046 RepID=A0A4R3Y9B8_9PROT|nr:PilW family protein [Sulfurirhabdus autotrophica]TCV88955.1 type IV pilus assembly protein PilW [Sulfurirhabdus autotrophica]
MPFNNKITIRYHSGFTLVEILVGMVIGLLAVMVIMQVFSVFEGQKRTTTGTADAQTNGAIALYNIQREALMAGFGLPVFDGNNTPLACTAFSPAGTNISPISITDGGTGSDSITIRYGDAPSGGIAVKIVGLSGNIMGVDTNMGCRVGDTALVVTGSSCSLSTVSGPTDIAIPPVPSGTPDTTHVNLATAISGVIPTTSSLSCLGVWNTITYAVSSNELQRAGFSSVADIVNIQAQYGISAAPNSNIITAWVNATGTWAAPSTADRNRIKAIRVAVVARNNLLEKAPVTNTCSSTTAASPTGLCAWGGTAGSPAPTIDVSAIPNWQRYRYKVFDTIIPIRNMIWSWDKL